MVSNRGATTNRPPHGRIRPYRWRAAALLVLLAALLGRGLGWFGRGGALEPATDGVASDQPTAQPVAGPAPEPAMAREPEPEPGPAAEPPPVEPAPPPAAAAPSAGPPAAPLAETAAEPAPGAPAAWPSVDPDRFGSLVSLLQTETEQRHFGRALAVLQQLRELPLDAAQQAALVLPVDGLQQGLAAACGAIVAQLADGRVLAADAAADRLLAADGTFVGPALAEALHLCGVAGALAGLPAPDRAPWPVPARLAKGRMVRTQLAGEDVTGRVVDSRTDEVTLRMPRAGGVQFPTVPVAACEPVDPTAAEAVEMGFAALQQGRGRLARLWLGCALLRGGSEPPSARQQRLAELLR